MDVNMMPVNVQNTAMFYYNMFFLKMSYLNYDREIILSTCIMIAAKLRDTLQLATKYIVSNQIHMNRYNKKMEQAIQE